MINIALGHYLMLAAIILLVLTLYFWKKSYIQRQLKTKSMFYKEALTALSIFETRKGIQTIEHWDKEHLFYNTPFTGRNGKILTLTNYYEINNIFTLEQILEEKSKKSRNLPFGQVLTNMFDNISN